MKKLLLLIILEICLVKLSFAQNQYQKFQVTKDIEVIKINDNAYVHVSYAEVSGWGRVASNGLIYLNNGEAALFDTPMTDSLTKDLMDWITSKLKAKVTLFVPNHWHRDCIGGLAYLNSLGIESYANEITVEIAKSKNLPMPAHGFRDSQTLSLGDKKIFCEFLGAAHAIDNIVVWLPSEKILFAGCMAKEVGSKNLGNTADADLTAYPETIKKVLNKYRNAEIVIPGHGEFGGIEILKHTLELSSKK
ncbi:MAG: Zn-dependent hydrolase [Stygiobacter sp.]|nr:MAG: Zn-dependent hydrolase [Stygiobacter sp.]KAF0213216.1 MAG: Zn-dependent [Ignavibacteria bacterium]